MSAAARFLTNLWMVAITMLVFTYGFVAWLRFPDCEAGHVAAYAPQMNSTWVCVAGREAVWTPPRYR